MPKTVDGIILIAKQSGMTSFSSLWQIKNALGMKKIGHTGTLDTFADGLLVALSGRLTRIVPYITGCDKEYLASIAFGMETDTLDPDGIPVRTAKLPLFGDIQASLPSFCGNIMQKPPVYSALHVDGQRASDRMRKGESIEIPARPVTVYSIDTENVETDDGSALSPDSAVRVLNLRIRCSKGTYIRSIARDLAQATGSAATLGNLRRTRIGPFTIENAAGCALLQPFASTKPASYGKGAKPAQIDPDEIRNSVVSYTRELSEATGLYPVDLKPEWSFQFQNGQPPEYAWFASSDQEKLRSAPDGTRFSVFCEARFEGVVSSMPEHPVYDFVIGADA